MEEISKSDMRELRRIQDSIPEEWKKRLLIKRKVSPNLARDVRKVANHPDLSEEQRRRVKTLIDSGALDQEEEVENKTITKKIAEYIKREQAKSIKAGRLNPQKNEK